jgi:hypothetical protein
MAPLPRLTAVPWLAPDEEEEEEEEDGVEEGGSEATYPTLLLPPPAVTPGLPPLVAAEADPAVATDWAR